MIYENYRQFDMDKAREWKRIDRKTQRQIRRKVSENSRKSRRDRLETMPKMQQSPTTLSAEGTGNV